MEPIELKRSCITISPTDSMGIYMIYNAESNKAYIGRSKNMYKRMLMHKKQLRLKKHPNNYLQSAWEKHGGECFIFYKIEICIEEHLNERESFWISQLDEDKRYNLRSDGPTYFLTSCVKEKLSKARRARVITHNTRKKTSESLMGHIVKEETKIKISRSRKGIKFSEEHIRKLSEAKRGRPSNNTKVRAATSR